MKYRLPVFTWVFILATLPASAFEGGSPEREKPRLRVELEEIPSALQQDFDRYVQELAARAKRDATPEERARKDDAAKERQPKPLNPLALFRW